MLLLVAAGHGPSVCLHLSFSYSSVFCFCLLFCCCYCCSYLLLLPPHWCVGTSLLGMAPGVSTCAAHPQGSQPPVRLCCCCCCPFCLELIGSVSTAFSFFSLFCSYALIPYIQPSCRRPLCICPGRCRLRVPRPSPLPTAKRLHPFIIWSAASCSA